MFKQIPYSNISTRRFKVYKEWFLDQSDASVIPASNEVGLFDLDTSTNVGNGIYTHTLYHSIKTKYYSANGNVISQFGVMYNPADYMVERLFSDQIYVIQIPQIKYGEQIKKRSVTLVDNDNGITYVDDGFGALRTELPRYILTGWNINTQIITFLVNGTTIEVTLSSLDLNSGIGTFTLGTTEDRYVSYIDFENNTMITNTPLFFNDVGLDSAIFGNVFYDDGLIVMTDSLAFSNYTVDYRSTQTIHETEILVTADRSEFNYSQNPSAVDVVLENSYDFTTTKITNVSPAKTVKIKEVRDITQKSSFVGTVGTGSGTWNDYSANVSLDPTGSYLSTFITTIGLYDSDGEMIAVAKLPKPIKKLPDYNVSFLVRFDN